jgi:two-component system chemotaxis sensor kinase CheA
MSARSISAILEDIAVKIMMVEPGDLSAVGELLELAEEISASENCRLSLLKEMAKAFHAALGQLIMGEIADSADNYEHIGQCVALMQELERVGKEDQSITTKFIDYLQQMGCKTDIQQLGSDSPVQEESPSPEEKKELDTRFLQDKELLAGFIEESFEHLESIENLILELEQNPDDKETINAVFRAFHTIKGTSALVDLDEINRLAHKTENLLDSVRQGQRALDSDVTDMVLKVRDMLQAMIQNVKDIAEHGVEHYHQFDISELINHLGEVEKTADVAEQSVEAVVEQTQTPAAPADTVSLGEGSVPDFMQDPDLLSGFISEAYEHLEAIEVNVLELEQSPDDLEIINNIFRPFHTIKGVSGFLNLKTINRLAHTTENLLDDVRNGIRPMSTEIIDVVLNVGDALRDMVQNVSEVLEQGPEAFKPVDISGYVNTIQALRNGDNAPSAPQSPVAEQPAPEPATPEVKPVSPAPKPDAVAEQLPAKPAPPRKKKTKAQAAIKVAVEKLDGLVNAVGELVIMQAMVRQNPLVTSIADPKLVKDFAQLSRITTELQKTAMSMRMVPIRQTFQKMTRLVRDLSKKTGKKVDLVMLGEETEIDRNMVDSIYDPLVHMMRNSVDHGIQPPDVREKSGKPATGTVKLAAYQKGGNIVIEIEDDGEGVATEKIRQKALERGLMQENDNLSDFEINNLIFLPGFSTADKITDVSGRGVGMDVVKKGVEKLRGTVELQSTPGEGSLFVMRLPLTLAIIDGIIVKVGSERYIIPTVAIQESLRPARENYNTVHGRGETLLIRDKLVPIIRLHELFDVEAKFTDPCDGIVVVVENEGRQRALLVDELLGKQEVVIKSLGGYLKDINGLAGGTILSDGLVGLILDLAGLFTASDDINDTGETPQ